MLWSIHLLLFAVSVIRFWIRKEAKKMTVEGIELTTEMIDNIRYWQANPEHIDGVAKVFDRAIATIAQDDPAAVGKEAQTRLMCKQSVNSVLQEVIYL